MTSTRPGGPVSPAAREPGIPDAEARYRTLVEQIPAIVYSAEFGEAGAWSYVSPQIESILGFRPQEWTADSELWFKHLHLEDRSRAMEEEARFRETGEPLSSEYRMVARDGRVVWFRDQASLVRDGGGRPLFMHGVMHDITDRKEAEQELAFLAYHDKLTGLPNRQMFAELLDLALVRAKRHSLSVAVLSMDLDDFKLVNETLGHAAGDEVLLDVTRRLRSTTRDTDLVARQGGDEFLVLLADLERGPRQGGSGDQARLVAETVAERVRAALEAPILVGKTELYATVSTGIALSPGDGDRGETLMKRADAAMHQSKKSGPGQFLLWSDGPAGSDGRLSLATRLRRAVEQQQWVLHYQPLVNMEGGEIEGVEALIRWRDPQGGIVPPGHFIPLAEEMGLIATIGEWVVGELCGRLRAWAARGASLKASFNLSPRQLWQPDLVNRLLHHVERNGVDPRSVVVEITESAAMVDPERTHRVLYEFRSHGLGLALDDFGTGHSSLARLKHFPLDILKIDQSFVHDVPKDREARAMVRAVIQLAHGLGMVPFAEGVETEAQRHFLIDNGCTRGQGFLFSQPLPAEGLAQQFLGLEPEPDENAELAG